MKVRKAVIPVAGLGTRFLPATKSLPKNMLPVLETPALHLVVEEAVKAGLDHVVFVVSPGQTGIQSYFQPDQELENVLEARGATDLLARVRGIPSVRKTELVVQREPLGFGHAVLTAKRAVGDEPFAMLLPDDLIWDETPTIGRMIELFDEKGGPVLALKEVPDEAVPALGIVEARSTAGRVHEIARLVEKPPLEEAPSNLAIIGRYVLTPQVFESLERTTPGAGGEIQVTDAIQALIGVQPVSGYRFPGYHVDVGTPLGLLKASVYAALRRDDLAPALRDWLRGEL